MYEKRLKGKEEERKKSWNTGDLNANAISQFIPSPAPRPEPDGNAMEPTTSWTFFFHSRFLLFRAGR
jgi:hypothetical protein